MRARPSCDGRRTALTGACCLGRSANIARAWGQRRATAPAVGPGGRPMKAWTCAGDAMELKTTSDAMRAQMRLRVGSRCGQEVGWDAVKGEGSYKLGVCSPVAADWVRRRRGS